MELCTALKLHKSTVHRLMMVLQQHRLVDKNPETGRYRLGLKLFDIIRRLGAEGDHREYDHDSRSAERRVEGSAVARLRD